MAPCLQPLRFHGGGHGSLELHGGYGNGPVCRDDRPRVAGGALPQPLECTIEPGCRNLLRLRSALRIHQHQRLDVHVHSLPNARPGSHASRKSKRPVSGALERKKIAPSVRGPVGALPLGSGRSGAEHPRPWSPACQRLLESAELSHKAGEQAGVPGAAPNRRCGGVSARFVRRPREHSVGHFQGALGFAPGCAGQRRGRAGVLQNGPRKIRDRP